MEDFLEAGRRGLPEFSAELLGIDYCFEVVFDCEGLDFQFLCGQEAVCEEGEGVFAAELIEDFAAVRGERDIRGVSAVKSDKLGNCLFVVGYFEDFKGGVEGLGAIAGGELAPEGVEDGLGGWRAGEAGEVLGD